jgi:Family of unknown function (DUF6527)
VSISSLEPVFIDQFPEALAAGTIYVSMLCGTAVHACCCGCGRKVFTPFGATDWKLIFDGDTVTLDPSIGNWNFPCQSHYWIVRNEIRWSPRWSQAQIDSGREFDRERKRSIPENSGLPAPTAIETRRETQKTKGLLSRLRNWFAAKPPDERH